MILLPPVILLVIPANFIVDSLVLLAGFKAFDISEKLKQYKKCILKVWCFGFLADILGSLLLLATQLFESNSFIMDKLTQPLMWNPFKSPYAFIYAVVVIAICAFLIYFFNNRFSFKKTDLTDKQRKLISILLAVVTAPYLFLLPTSLFY